MKEKITNFTFKIERDVWHGDSYLIKYKRKEVGYIDTKFRIRLMVIKDDINEDGNKNCSWKWITLKKEFNSFDEAKIFLNENKYALHDKYNFNLI